VLLPDDLRQQLATAIDRLRPHAADVAWVAPANLHVTLKFLGQVEETRVSALADALRTALVDQPPLEVAVRGLGAFPSPTRPRVLWAGLEDVTRGMTALAERVDGCCAHLGFPAETRDFAAHVTLGRVREARRQPALADVLARPADFGRLRVERVSLMRSELSPRGARYSELFAAPLAVQ
jgi:RNA 2',3'-cyclic 3'-phosphodiesterase